jgi:hypothetical protein
MTNPIQCPRCQDPIAIKDPRPGRFRIRCPKCGEPFALTVPEDPEGRPIASIAEPSTARPDRPAPVPAPAPDPAADEVAVPSRNPDPPFQPPRILGGFRVGGLLETSRSGAVFRARRWPMGGEAAVAIVRPRWASDARFVARFVREAFAAGQLRHPNLWPIREIGIEKGLPLAASGAPAGFPLSDPERGRVGLDRTARAAAILHAARALRMAHEQGVYHRDLSLDRIRVEPSGLVRLTGLGVGLTPETPEAPAVAAVEPAGAGGPSPPAAPGPEPLSAGFAREDVGALGRALQSLIGGPRADRAVPPGLALVARRMADEGPEPPFPDLAAATRALEAELGVAGPFAPHDEEASEFEALARAFDEPPLVRVRGLVAIGSAGLCALLAALALVLGRPLSALGVLGFGTLAAWSLVMVRGILGTDPVFGRARDLALGGGRNDALTAAAGLALVLGALVASHLLGTWIVLGLLAAGAATAYHFALDRPIALARGGASERAGALLLGLRRLGVAEDDLRRFACRQPGARWEEFFEALFGYEAMRAARARWGLDAGGKRRPRFAPWRDPIADWLDAKLDARRLELDRALLRGTEERGAEARGINLLTARRKAHRVADALVSLGGQYRRSLDASVGLPLMNAMLRATERPEEFLAAAEALEGPSGPPLWREALGLAARVAFGPRARFLAGAALLAGFLVWMNENALIDASQIKRDALAATSDREQAVANAEKLGRKLAENVQGVAGGALATRDLEFRYLPPAVARRLDGFGLGVAGLILVLSSFAPGVRFAAFAVPGALVAALGPRLVDPAARPLGAESLMAMAIGGGLFALGVAFGRSRA